MNMHMKSSLEIVLGAAIIAACSGKLAVDDAHNGVNSNGGSAGTGGATGDASPPGSGGGVEAGGTGGKGSGGLAVGTGGWISPPAGGSPETGGWIGNGGAPGGSAGCFSGTEPPGSAGGILGAGGIGGVTPTCPLDSEGFASVDLSAMCEKYRCADTSAELLGNLRCADVTTERRGFTRTIGCGVETVEFQSYDFRGAYDLEHKYAATYDIATGQLLGLVVKEPYQFEPCMSYAYRAGTIPADCPDAVTYSCSRIDSPAGAEAYAGCRGPDQPGCAQCCEPYSSEASTLYSAANGSTTYQVGQGYNHACTCGVENCAKCKLEDERGLRVMIRHTECNCSLPPTGEPCNSWCSNKQYWENLCPGVL